MRAVGPGRGIPNHPLGGVRGRRAAYGTLAGILCLLLVLFVYVFRTGGHA